MNLTPQLATAILAAGTAALVCGLVTVAHEIDQPRMSFRRVAGGFTLASVGLAAWIKIVGSM